MCWKSILIVFFFEELWSQQESLSSSPARENHPPNNLPRFIQMPREMEFNYFHSLPFMSKTNLFFVFFWLKDTGRNILETLKPYFLRRMSATTLWMRTCDERFHQNSMTLLASLLVSIQCLRIHRHISWREISMKTNDAGRLFPC